MSSPAHRPHAPPSPTTTIRSMRDLRTETKSHPAPRRSYAFQVNNASSWADVLASLQDYVAFLETALERPVVRPLSLSALSSFSSELGGTATNVTNPTSVTEELPPQLSVSVHNSSTVAVDKTSTPSCYTVFDHVRPMLHKPDQRLFSQDTDHATDTFDSPSGPEVSPPPPVSVHPASHSVTVREEPLSSAGEDIDPNPESDFEDVRGSGSGDTASKHHFRLEDLTAKDTNKPPFDFATWLASLPGVDISFPLSDAIAGGWRSSSSEVDMGHGESGDMDDASVSSSVPVLVTPGVVAWVVRTAAAMLSTSGCGGLPTFDEQGSETAGSGPVVASSSAGRESMKMLG
ncbi:hypothetical protein CONLIGDRAFT_638436 [Coniochaeta ligniaria NRRL 30616]|uniref:Uncharacterized protein n=1 Tax=Coniochaeta ligniaria NRRL 30616 TaxID=1408157 RepID=A0A1J7J488_9PEZI|nr:hypothetical protein CONLIGDRAFT_638436 [Coniochaeta ligniaria NRRL 30616]